MGKYCTASAVMTRLEGKVKFAKPGEMDDENRMSIVLLNTLIGEAESQLEIDLMDRYELPFQHYCGKPFSALPDSSRITLQNLAELISVIRVLETDFGRGTSANSEKYTAACQKRYDSVIEKLMAYKEETKGSSRQWMRRPLDAVAVAYNNQGDNGFRGRVSTTTSTHHHSSNYAVDQINDPAENLFNDLDRNWVR